MIPEFNPTLSKTLDDAVILTPEQEQQAFKDLKSKVHKKRGIDALVNGNLRLVIDIIKKFRNHPEYEDMIMAGFNGLILAAKKFDPDKGFKFGTYARWWVLQQAIEVMEKSTLVKIPATFPNKTYPGEWVANGTRGKTTEDHVEYRCSSLNAPIGPDWGDEVLDFYAGDDDVMANVITGDEEEYCRRLLSTLKPREAEMVSMYWGIRGTPMTLQEIADTFDLTRERIRQIKNKAFRKMREQARRWAREAERENPRYERSEYELAAGD